MLTEDDCRFINNALLVGGIQLGVVAEVTENAVVISVVDDSSRTLDTVESAYYAALSQLEEKFNRKFSRLGSMRIDARHIATRLR